MVLELIDFRPGCAEPSYDTVSQNGRSPGAREAVGPFLMGGRGEREQRDHHRRPAWAPVPARAPEHLTCRSSSSLASLATRVWCRSTG